MASEDQLILIDIISSIKLLSIDSIMQTVRQIIKQPPAQTAISSASKVRTHFSVFLTIVYYLNNCTIHNRLLLIRAVKRLIFLIVLLMALIF